MSIKKSIFQKLKLLPIGIIIVLIVLLGLSVYAKNRAPQEVHGVPRYADITWSEAKKSSVYALLNPDTTEEDVVFTEGVEIIGEDLQGDPQKLLTYYDTWLIQNQFTQITSTGDYKTDRYWTRSYRKGHFFIEIQYYVTPENSNTQTAMVFSGILQR